MPALKKLLKESHQGISLNRYQDDSEELRYLVNQSDLKQLHIKKQTLKQIRARIPKSKYLLQVGDVVITLRNSPLKAGVVTQEVENAIAGQNLAVLRPNSKAINSLYLAVLMRSQWMQTKLELLYVYSTAIPLIRLSQLHDLEIPVPSLEKQRKLAELFYIIQQVNQKALEEIEARQKIAEATLIETINK